jgi:hypothetical protein
MLFALKYRPIENRTEAESLYVHQLASAWNPPAATIRHHFHNVSGGGVVFVDIEKDIAPLLESLEPFRPFVDFGIEPVLNMAEAVAISLNVDEWKASVLAGAVNR